MRNYLGSVVVNLISAGLLDYANLLGAWLDEAAGCLLVLRFRSHPDADSFVMALREEEVAVVTAGVSRNFVQDLLAGARSSPSVDALTNSSAASPWPTPPTTVPALRGFSSSALKFPILTPPADSDSMGMREKAIHLYHGHSWAETALVRALILWDTPNSKEWAPIGGVWITAPDAVTIAVALDVVDRDLSYPVNPEASTWSFGGRWLTVVYTFLAHGQWDNPWNVRYLGEGLGQIQEVTPGYEEQFQLQPQSRPSDYREGILFLTGREILQKQERSFCEKLSKRFHKER